MTDIAKIPDDNGELVPLTPEMVGKWLEGSDLPEVADAEEIALADAVRILSADNEEEALRPTDKRESKQMVGVPFVVHAVTWLRSTKSEDGKGRYALMSCTDEQGDSFIMSCGATKVVLQLRKAQLDRWLPWQVQMESTTTNSGNTVFSLVAPEKPF